MEQTIGQAIFNIIKSKNIFTSLVNKGKIGYHDVTFIQGDDVNNVIDVRYDNANKKLYYTNDDNYTQDIITISAIKNAMDLPPIATSASYNDLSNQPKINNVVLVGNKTTADLNISYNDLADQPSIPELTQTYNSTDGSKAMTGIATAQATSNLVPNSRTVTGTGALSGGGSLVENRQITHNLAPTGLNTSASKIGVDQYGHVQAGEPIAAADVQAQRSTISFQSSVTSLDARYGTVVVLATVPNEQVGFSNMFEPGEKFDLLWINSSDSNMGIIIPYPIAGINHVYLNGHIMSEPQTITADPTECKKFSCVYGENNGAYYLFINE